MSTLKVVEGETDFYVPSAGKPTKTWYKVVGDIASSTRRPLVAVHGGPGFTHDYLLPLIDLTTSLSIPVIFYDQIGNGRSTHLPEKKGDTTFWTEQLFLDELNNLLVHLGIQDNYDLLGHSWGGMLGSRHASLQPKGLKRLVLSCAPADMGLWDKAQLMFRSELPQDVQDTLVKHEAAGTTESQEYKDAMDVYYLRHSCTLKPLPEEFLAGLAWSERDPTVSHTMDGTSSWECTGPLKDWSMVNEAHKINVPTLLLNGRYDQAHDITVYPFFRAIRTVKWVVFAKSAHVPQLEERERYVEVVGAFLTD